MIYKRTERISIR